MEKAGAFAASFFLLRRWNRIDEAPKTHGFFKYDIIILKQTIKICFYCHGTAGNSSRRAGIPVRKNNILLQ